MKKYYTILVILLIITACNKRKMSEDEEHLYTYFKEKQNTDLHKLNNFFIVVISGNCGSCTEKTIKFLKQLGDKKENKFGDYKKIVVIPSNNAEVLDSIKNSNIQFIVDEGFELEKYGVNFQRNAFFEFKKSELFYKDWLYLDNVDTVAKKYGFILK
ncbi:hypothetical protein EZ456_09570 [Pedobacter psychrodurus]|uniref:Lipoprotein n=1 Tax=Pedobacter psychrodurus TaxID=2530456 RepID=A0A4R0PXB8_9SPHI|nr:hypothetical protein [Pedobacter psychrodurus]TCD27434.1 hypothetical protein EZ456_09570 [Pedobacter psychrodurus]